MKFTLTCLFALTLPCLIASQSNAAGLKMGPAQKEISPPKATVPATVGNLTGIWSDRIGGIMIIREQDLFLDISAADKGSIYRMTCLIEPQNQTQANCVGDGIIHSENINSRFLYQSSLTFTPEGTITEEWTVTSSTGELKGEAVFRKLADTSPR